MKPVFVKIVKKNLSLTMKLPKVIDDLCQPAYVYFILVSISSLLYVYILFDQSTRLDINVKEVVIEEFEMASYASGTYQQAQDIDYMSDSVDGGWGTSGIFWSSKNGIIRSLVSGTEFTEDTCESSWNVAGGKQPGDYHLEENGYDTSANFNSHFFVDVVGNAKRACPRFNTGIVKI